EAAAARQEHAGLATELETGRAALAHAEALRAAREAELVEEEQRVAAAARAAADRREGLARLTGQVAAARSRVTAGEEEIERLARSLEAARERATAAHRDYVALETQVADLDQGEMGLDEQYEQATKALAAAEADLNALQAEEREAERDRSALAARVEALQLGLTRKDGSGALLAAGDRLPGLLGPVAELVDVRDGWEVAIAVALGGAADAIAVTSLESATSALRLLKDDDAGRAGVLVGGAHYDAPVWPALPSGASYAIDLVTSPAELRPALTALLERVAVVADIEAGRDLVQALPSVRAVTRDGDLLGTGWVVGGSAKPPSLLEVQAAVVDATERLREATHGCERLRFELGAAQERRAAAVTEVESTLSRLHESDARMAAVAEQLAHLGSAARATAGEAERLGQAREQAVTAREQDRVALSALEERLAAAEVAPDEDEPTGEARDVLRGEVERLRGAEVDARLAVRTTEERARAAAARAEQMERAAVSERAARERLISMRSRRAREAVVAAAVVTGVAAALTRIEASLTDAAAEREAAEQARTVREGELLALRAKARELAAELERLTDVVHRDEVARAEQRLRIEQLETRLAEEYGLDGETVIGEYGPDVLVPPSVLEDGTAPEDGVSVAYVREEQEKRLRTAERALALLGKVNPLALEEYAALEERHRFLSEQLEDLKSTRRDLMDIIRDVDERVQQVFAEAFADTAREFEVVFRTLFPGGDGKLVLTDPSDMQATGVEVLARPAGKKVSRLSLLSGGERSLTALALLIAIFKARPSPFYVLDEVEAALDDRNLSRLLDSIETLRETSQLIVITHQKRTMEIADSLYGVSMRNDGVSAVISQRMREAEPA
ncbi:MAG: chromosome segregation protein, partial [Frankiales bacterium]|nr:chromosome segregation protein [Frankiales bacterium]